jgi:Holliday junction resolvase
VSLRELAAKNEQKRRRRLKSRRKKDYRAECQLVRKLRKYGFKAVRVPVSALSKEPLPDIFATKGETILAFEVKTQNSGRTHFKKNQTKKLFDFLSIFNIYGRKIAVLAGKFPYKWVFKKIEKPGDYTFSREEKGNIKLKSM